MVKTTHIVEVNSNVSLSLENDVVICTQVAPITITLPSITCNGIRYKISRNDKVNANTVTLNAGANQIISGSTSASTLVMGISTFVEIISYETDWYVVQNIFINPRLSLGLYSTTYVANNSTPYLVLAGNSNTIVSRFPYISSFLSPIFFSVCVTWISGTVTGFFRFGTNINPSIQSVAVNISSGTQVFSTLVPGFVGTPSYILFSWDGQSGANDKLGLNFIRCV